MDKEGAGAALAGRAIAAHESVVANAASANPAANRLVPHRISVE
ncbi:MAG TPA: hypothetical protein VEJ41_03985 [Candidatus Acidoferrales bacterium]|nr:hypothetical protein [Candidatus Acidoferrales bacterium]